MIKIGDKYRRIDTSEAGSVAANPLNNEVFVITHLLRPMGEFRGRSISRDFTWESSINEYKDLWEKVFVEYPEDGDWE